MLQAFGDHAQGEGLNLSDGFASVGAAAEHARQCRHFGQPAAIVFPFELNANATT